MGKPCWVNVMVARNRDVPIGQRGMLINADCDNGRSCRRPGWPAARQAQFSVSRLTKVRFIGMCRARGQSAVKHFRYIGICILRPEREQNRCWS
jgi:hypothetical protein